jgi:hypothetical protein
MSGSIFNGGNPPIGLSIGSMLIELIGAGWLIMSGLTLVISFISSSMLSMPCALRFKLILGGGVSGFSGIGGMLIGMLGDIGESPQASVAGLSNSCILANRS